MSFVKGLAIWIARFIGIFFVATAIGAFVPRPFSAERGTPTKEILLLSNTIHTDIAIALNAETRARFSWLGLPSGIKIDNPDAGYLIVGWGGESFYLETPTWSDLKPMPVFKAFTLDNSVMHVDLARSTLADNPTVQTWKISSDSHEKLLAFIENSFKKQHGEPMVFSGKAFGRTDRFFKANGSFNAVMGCNTWTAAALREAGLTTGLWNPLPLSLQTSLALFN